MNAKNYYEVLGLENKASEEEIRKAYLKLAAQFHPDVYKEDKGEKFKEIKNAYDTLSSNEKRREYDAFLNSSSSKTQTNFEDYQRSRNYANNFQNSDFFGGNKSNTSFEFLFSSGKDNFLEELFESDFFTNFKDSDGFYFQGNDWTNIPDIQLNISLDFNDTAFGSEKTITFSRKYYCENCQWWKYSNCQFCSSKGYTVKDEKIKVKIPGCLPNGSVLKVPKKGNFYRRFSSDLMIKVQVTSQINENLFLQKNNIVQHVFLSLHDALFTEKIKVKNCLEKYFEFKLDKKIQSGDRIIFKRRGGVDSSGHRGDYILVIFFFINRELNKETREKIFQDPASKINSSFKIKDIYEND